MKYVLRGLLAGLVILAFVVPGLAADKVPTVYPMALLPFRERGDEVRDFGSKVTDLLFANLVVNADLYLVEREDLDKILEEMKLNLTGIVSPDQAVQVGQLTGAKVLVTGSVIQVDKSIYLVAKLIGTETSRVLGASVKGDVADDLAPLVEELAGEIGKTIKARANQLVAKRLTREDRIAALKERVASKKRPTVMVSVSERHIGQATIDPAAETELTLFLTECGFEVLSSDGPTRPKPDVMLKGEGFSEFAGRSGELISVKARLEVKAIEARTGQVLAIDRQTAVMVDLTEQIAGKAALQDAAADIAERLLPKLVTVEKPKKKR